MTAALDRVAVLTEAMEVLTSSSDPEQLAQRIARVWVPRVADFCVIEEHAADGRRRVLALAHADPAMEVVLLELTSRYASVEDAANHPSAGAVMANGYLRVDMTPEVLARHLEGRSESAQAAIHRLAPTSYVVVPLVGRGRVLGVQTLGMSVSGRRFTDEDVEFVRQLAAHAARAVETTRLYLDLAASEARFRTLVQEGPVAVLVTSLRDGRVVDMNPQFERQSGHRREEAIGRPISELGIYANPADGARIRARLAAGEVLRNIEIVGRSRTGEHCPLLISYSLVEIGGDTCVVGMAHDLTELRRLQEQLWQASKLDALGRLAGAVAHDFNNSLTKIIGYLEILREKLEPGPLRGYVEQGHRTALRASALSGQMLAFSRSQVLSPRLLDLNSVLDDVDIFRHLLGEASELTLERAPAPLHVVADPAQLEQVLVNLVLNARDAMPSGGRVTIRTAGEGEWARLSVSDTGVGMDAAAKARLFEPFFTTKPGGNGLGLASVHGAVTQSGGTVAVDSEPGRGTTFLIRLPRAAPAPADSAQARKGAFAGTGTVLLVEDDDDLRAVLGLTLGSLGFTVIEARNGPAALRLAEGHNGSIKLLLTDVIMPGMGGPELAERLSAAHAELRILFMSGYTGDAAAALAASKHSIFLRKPFTREELLARLRDALA